MSSTASRNHDSTPRRGFESRAWRIPATGMCFLLFFAGAAAFAIVVLGYRAAVPDASVRRPRVQRILGAMLRFFRWTVSALGLTRFHIDGLERVPREGSFVIICNHPTLIDAPILLGLFPHAVCIVKSALLQSWAYRVAIEELGFLASLGSERFIEDCVRAVQSGRPLLIFPEGTRSDRDSLRRFERGAATIAIRAGVPILPVVLECRPPMLQRGSRWFEVPARSVDFNLSIQYPLFPASDSANERELSHRVTAEMEAFFRSRLARTAKQPSAANISAANAE